MDFILKKITYVLQPSGYYFAIPNQNPFPHKHFHSIIKNFFRTNWWILICKLRSKRRLSSDHACMKNISAEVSIFCLWTKWRHLVTCSKIEFRELYYSCRCALDKICEIYTFDRCPKGWSIRKSFLACNDAKKENWRTAKLSLKHVS